MPNRRLVLPVLVLLIAFAARTLDLSAQSLWYDEGYTVSVAQGSIGQPSSRWNAVKRPCS